MRFAIRDHYGKGTRLAEVLKSAGHEQVMLGRPANLLLIDLDAPGYGYLELIATYKAFGATVIMYPHGANPSPVYDGMWAPSKDVDACLVYARGHEQLLNLLGYPNPIHIIGWPLCELRPFRAVENPQKILFAPTHPPGVGRMSFQAREQNREVFEQLLDVPRKLTVRLLGTPQQNGLQQVKNVNFVPGNFEISHAEIDTHDLVVAGVGTFPSLAIARGVPTIMYGQDVPPEWGHDGAQEVILSNPEKYSNLIRYPLDMADRSLSNLISRACSGQKKVDMWRNKFIGQQFNDKEFLYLVERLVAL